MKKIRDYLSSGNLQSNTVDTYLKEGQSVTKACSEATMETGWGR